MKMTSLTGLHPTVVRRATPFLMELLSRHESDIHSAHLVGSAVTDDFIEKTSDINSLVVLHRMDLGFIERLAPLGKKFGRKGIAAPLVMTPEYIQRSLDSFPVEFLDFRLLHRTVSGDDILKDLSVPRQPLQLQCERELKTKLIGLRQGYLFSLGKRRLLAPVLVRSFTGSLPLFRSIIHILGKEPPVLRRDVLAVLGAATKIDTTVFERLTMLKTRHLKPSDQELRGLFEDYYRTLESLGTIVDELHR